eukprot:PhF_6_TR29295/c1_g1_i2/m.42947
MIVSLNHFVITLICIGVVLHEGSSVVLVPDLSILNSTISTHNLSTVFLLRHLNLKQTQFVFEGEVLMWGVRLRLENQTRNITQKCIRFGVVEDAAVAPFNHSELTQSLTPDRFLLWNPKGRWFVPKDFYGWIRNASITVDHTQAACRRIDAVNISWSLEYRDCVFSFVTGTYYHETDPENNMTYPDQFNVEFSSLLYNEYNGMLFEKNEFESLYTQDNYLPSEGLYPSGWLCGRGAGNGTWYWECGPWSGQPFRYTNWAKGEPSILDGCLYVCGSRCGSNGVWYSHKCSGTKGAALLTVEWKQPAKVFGFITVELSKVFPNRARAVTVTQTLGLCVFQTVPQIVSIAEPSKAILLTLQGSSACTSWSPQHATCFSGALLASGGFTSQKIISVATVGNGTVNVTFSFTTRGNSLISLKRSSSDSCPTFSGALNITAGTTTRGGDLQGNTVPGDLQQAKGTLLALQGVSALIGSDVGVDAQMLMALRSMKCRFGTLSDASSLHLTAVLQVDSLQNVSPYSAEVLLGLIILLLAYVIAWMAIQCSSSISFTSVEAIMISLQYPKTVLRFHVLQLLPSVAATANSPELYLTIPCCVVLVLSLMCTHVYVCYRFPIRFVVRAAIETTTTTTTPSHSYVHQIALIPNGEWKPRIASTIGGPLYEKYRSITMLRGRVSIRAHSIFWTTFGLGAITVMLSSLPMTNDSTCTAVMFVISLSAVGLSLFYLLYEPTVIRLVSWLRAARHGLFAVIGFMLSLRSHTDSEDSSSADFNFQVAAAVFVWAHIVLGYTEMLHQTVLVVVTRLRSKSESNIVNDEEEEDVERKDEHKTFHEDEELTEFRSALLASEQRPPEKRNLGVEL